MLNWRTVVSDDVLPVVAGDGYWESNLREIMSDDASPFGLHLAVFVEPYLSYILEGKKTVESRFATRKFAPFRQIVPGDVILLKQSSGPIRGLCTVSDVWFYNLAPNSWKKLRSEFAEALCAQDPDFWKARQNASYATLMRLSFVRSIDPVAFPKQDRRGWVVLRSSGSLFS
jgi:ASC-1-like (ASCH) protein